MTGSPRTPSWHIGGDSALPHGALRSRSALVPKQGSGISRPSLSKKVSALFEDRMPEAALVTFELGEEYSHEGDPVKRLNGHPGKPWRPMTSFNPDPQRGLLIRPGSVARSSMLPSRGSDVGSNPTRGIPLQPRTKSPVLGGDFNRKVGGLNLKCGAPPSESACPTSTASLCLVRSTPPAGAGVTWQELAVVIRCTPSPLTGPKRGALRHRDEAHRDDRAVAREPAADFQLPERWTRDA